MADNEGQRKMCPKTKWHFKTITSSQQRGLLCGVGLGARPAREHKGDLVDNVRNVVDHVEDGVIHGAEQVAEEVASGVDGPAHGDDHAHVVERSCNVWAAVTGKTTGLTAEDLEQDESPAAHAHGETWPCRDDALLAHVAECKHQDSSEEELPESCGSGGLAGRLEDQVEFDHLQWHGDAPVNVPVHNWGLVDLDPVLAHVHVVDTCHQSDETSNMQGCLPVILDGTGIREEEHCCCNHGDGDDPE